MVSVKHALGEMSMEEWLLSLDSSLLFYFGGLIGCTFFCFLSHVFIEGEGFEKDEVGLLIFIVFLWPVFPVAILAEETLSSRLLGILGFVLCLTFGWAFPFVVAFGFGILALCFCGIVHVLLFLDFSERLSLKRSLPLTVIISALVFGGQYTYHELTLSPEEQLARERASLAEEKRELEEEHAQAVAEAQERVKAEQERREREAREAKERRAQELKDARTRVEIVKVQAERAKLRNQSIPKEVAEQIAQANKQLEQLQSTPSVTGSTSTELAKAREELARLKREGVDYSKLSETKITSAPPVQPRTPSAPIDDQTKLILSGLWLGACFFLQRVFEKLFKDKGYALLTVCAAGFLLAFFTANYFLLGGSVTGGVMGSVGDRG